MKKSVIKTVSIILSLMFVLSAVGMASSAFEYFQIGTEGYVEYGVYPQKEVKDTDTIAQLNESATEWTSYNYCSGTCSSEDEAILTATAATQSNLMEYTDVTLGDNLYRGVRINSARPIAAVATSDSSEQTYAAGSTYWFLYQPVIWRVLDSTTGLLLCDMILDSQAFNNIMYYNEETESYTTADGTAASNNYATSDIYNSFLNGSLFTGTIFTGTSDASYKTSTFGLMTAAMFTDYTIFAPAVSDYARCQGLSTSYKGDNYYWLQDAEEGSNIAKIADCKNNSIVVPGDDNDVTGTVIVTVVGVRPTVTVDPSILVETEHENTADEETTVPSATDPEDPGESDDIIIDGEESVGSNENGTNENGTNENGTNGNGTNENGTNGNGTNENGTNENSQSSTTETTTHRSTYRVTTKASSVKVTDIISILRQIFEIMFFKVRV